MGPDEAGADNESAERAAAGTESATARRANFATPVSSISFAPAPPVNGGRPPIREVRGGQGQVHGRSIANETLGWRRYHSVVSVAAASGPIAALSGPARVVGPIRATEQ